MTDLDPADSGDDNASSTELGAEWFSDQPALTGLPPEYLFEATWSAPVPPPIIIRQYNEIQPGMGDRLVQQWLDETEHRRQRERASDRMEADAVKRAQRIGGAVFIILALGATISGVMGHGVAAGALASAGVIGGIAPVLYGWVQTQRGHDE